MGVIHRAWDLQPIRWVALPALEHSFVFVLVFFAVRGNSQLRHLGGRFFLIGLDCNVSYALKLEMFMHTRLAEGLSFRFTLRVNEWPVFST